ncbi:putative protein [Vanrija pseudolonga]|uniref:Purtative protein n=1 Tax=Vanrija pseudolonga TaxID=143232 RepID=A0AAF1BK07_9TREE|nr:purtative protein [Vanrija pseudolonga]
MSTTSPAQASPSSWRRRLSHPDIGDPSSYLPSLSLPSVSGLRSAVLTYLGEVENALRDKLAGEYRGVDSVTSGSPPPSSEDETDEHEHDHAGAPDDYFSFGESSALRAPRHNEFELRRRAYHARSPALSGSSSNEDDANVRMLDYLSSLRADILSYANSAPGFGLGSSLSSQREWIRGLPGRLRTVELGLGEPGSWPDPLSASSRAGSRAVQGARKRVIDLVHTLLPPDDWAGWETLGWEEGGEDADVGADATPQRPRQQRPQPYPHRAHAKTYSLDERALHSDDEDELDEPEYLFPNRTPGPAQAIARRTRAIRARSLGAMDLPPLPSFIQDWMRPVVEEASKVVDDEGDVDAQVVESSLESQDEDEKDELASVLSFHDEGPTVAEALVRSHDGKKLITFDDLPFWWRNNQYIHTGYRFIPLGKSGPIPLLKSAFQIHNETINIHSHSVPTVLILSIAIPLIVWRSPLPDAKWLDTAMLVTYLLAATSCMSSSAGWHMLSGCASKRWFEWGACVDYIGISWLIAMSFNTVVYNAYYCYPKTVVLYTLINIGFGALGSYLPFQKWFNQRKNKPWRITFFVTLAVSMFTPLAQLFYYEGFERAAAFTSPFGVSVLAYVLGLFAYAFHWPECIWPGKFDLWGASHQIWHFGIVIAIGLHYRAIFHAYNLRWDYSCAAPDAQMPVTAAVSQLIWGPVA